MKGRKPKLTNAEKIENQYPYSSRLRRVGCRVQFLLSDINRDGRKVIPVAVLARKFDISKRLLWNWIHDGLIVKKPRMAPGPISLVGRSIRRKNGVAKSAVLNFLKRLQAVVASESDAWNNGSDFWDSLPRDDVPYHDSRSLMEPDGLIWTNSNPRSDRRAVHRALFLRYQVTAGELRERYGRAA